MTGQATGQRSRPRKEPSQARARHTVESIVEAAARILEEEGHSGFNTNAVAQRAGVSIGTFYQYFPDKDSLLGSLIARETRRLIEDVEIASSTASGQKALDALIVAAVQHQTRRPRLAIIIDLEEARLPLDTQTQIVRAKFVSVLAEILSRKDMDHQNDLLTITGDTMAIIRGVLDAAGERGEDDQAALMERVRRAVFGYLSMPARD